MGSFGFTPEVQLLNPVFIRECGLMTHDSASCWTEVQDMFHHSQKYPENQD